MSRTGAANLFVHLGDNPEPPESALCDLSALIGERPLERCALYEFLVSGLRCQLEGLSGELRRGLSRAIGPSDLRRRARIGHLRHPHPYQDRDHARDGQGGRSLWRSVNLDLARLHPGALPRRLQRLAHLSALARKDPHPFRYLRRSASRPDGRPEGRGLQGRERLVNEDMALSEAVHANLASGVFLGGPLSSRHEEGVALSTTCCAAQAWPSSILSVVPPCEGRATGSE